MSVSIETSTNQHEAAEWSCARPPRNNICKLQVCHSSRNDLNEAVPTCYQPGSFAPVHGLEVCQDPGELLAARAEVMLCGELQEMDGPMVEGVPARQSLPLRQHFVMSCIVIEQLTDSRLSARTQSQQGEEILIFPTVS